MKLNEILLKNDVTLSFEVFPPKATANYEAVQKAAYGVAQLKPSYMSVTYGAGARAAIRLGSRRASRKRTG